jgi:hypothetical protein
VRRAGGQVRSALAVVMTTAALALCLPAPSAAQERPQGRTATEPELKAARDRASNAYLHANARLQKARTDFEAQRARRATLIAEQRRLEAEGAGILRDYQLGELRQELRRVAEDYREAQHQLEDSRSEERVRRLELIRASWSWVTRLLEVADRVHEDRPIDAQRLASTAAEELQLIENLEHGIEPVPPVEVPPLEDPSAVPLDQLERLIGLFSELAERAEQRARDLEPERQKLDERVRRLDKLVNDRKVRELTERLERAREDLAQVAGLVEGEGTRAVDYRARVQTLEAERSSRKERR